MASTDSLAPCADGYERNPETNRCRKIRATTADEYPVEDAIEGGSYDSKKIFIATGAIIAIGVTIAVCIAVQFRQEIKRRFQHIFARRKV